MNIGIVSYGLYIPSEVETAADVAKRSGLTVEEVLNLGIEGKPIPSGDDQPVVMAERAAKEAFERAESVRPEDVDVVIWTGEEYKDYIAQTASIRLQEDLGCHRAWSFDLVAQGVTTIQGLRIARDLILSDETVHTVLLAGGTRNVDLVDYTNPDTHFLLAASASGGAFLLQGDYEKNRILDTAFTVDPEMSDEVFVPGGGTEIPFSADNLDSDVMYFQAARPEKVRNYLRSRWTEALVETSKKVLTHQAPDYLALRHLAPDDRSTVLDTLGVMPEQSVPLNAWGHHGPNDVILSIDLGLKAGAIGDGSDVVLVSGGIGFTYASALIRWGATEESTAGNIR
jgi:3-oxoacyl-[acyl-carrier-protein] synthase-3